jgi:uncharacterized protein YoxC
MADPQVKIKFTTDTSALKSGMDQATSDAKQKVKELSDDVSKESKDMEDSLDKVADSTKDIGKAADQASQGVKGLENQVSRSASSMEKNLASVADKLKNVSARQVAGLAAQGLNNIAGSLSENLGDTAGGQYGASALRGAASGMLMGAIAGPIGIAAGGLAGAATGLMEAAVDLKSAAQDQNIANGKIMDSARQGVMDRRSAEGRQREVQGRIDNLNAAQGNEAARAAITNAQELVNDRQEAARAARARYEELAMNATHTGDLEQDKATLAELDRARREMDQAELAAAELAPLIATIAAKEEEIRQSIVAELQATDRQIKAQQEKEAAEKAKAAKMEDAARRAADEDANERLIRALDPFSDPAYVAERQAELKDQLKGAQSELTGSQRELEGVGRTTVGVTDDLTRIGGGAGYASYNNSVGDNVKTISNSLKQLIQLQQSNVDRLVNTLEDIKVTGAGTWGD